MIFPYFFVMVLGAIAIVTAVSAIYFQLYKRHVNRAVKEGKRTAPKMVSPLYVLLITAIPVSVAPMVIRYFLGYQKAY